MHFPKLVTSFFILLVLVIMSISLTVRQETRVVYVARRDQADTVQSERRKRLTRVCAMDQSRSKKRSWKYYVADHSRKLVYAWIPKAMSSSMFYALVCTKPSFQKAHPDLSVSSNDIPAFYTKEKSSGSWSQFSHSHGLVLHKYGLVSLETQKTSSVSYALSNYFVFVIVRDPFSRLASTFHNLLDHGPAKRHTFWTYIYNHMLKRVRSKKRTSIMFNDFLEYITDKEEDARNPHWDTYRKLLKPCNVRFDYIAKLETIATDLPFIMEKISKKNASSLLQLKSNKSKKDKLGCLYQSVSPSVLERVIRKYKKDFLMFGYDMHRFSNISNIEC